MSPDMRAGAASDQFDERLAQLRAVAEPTRFRLLRLLIKAELTVTELTVIVEQSQPGVSRHLRLLAEAGLAERSREGAWALYRATLSQPIAALLPDITSDAITNDDERLEMVLGERTRAAAAYFARHAEDWDVVRRLQGDPAFIENEIRDVVMTLPRIEQDRRSCLVDLGTGTGRMLTLLSDLFDESVGLDASPEMLRVARVNTAATPNVRLRLGNLLEVGDLEPSIADLVVLHHVLHFLTDPCVAIDNALRMTRDGHVLVVDFASHDRDELLRDHAHVRSGFADDEIERWAVAAGATVSDVRTLTADDPHGLTSKLWVLSTQSRPIHSERAAAQIEHAAH